MSLNATPTPIQRFTFASRDPEETTEFFRRSYGDHRTRFRNVAPRNTGIAARSASIGQLQADRIQFTISLEVDLDPVDTLLCGQLLRGRCAFDTRSEQARLRRGDCVLYPVSELLNARSSNVDYAILALPFAPVARLAAEYGGIDPGGLRFTSMSPVTAAAGQSFGRTLAMLQRELNAPDTDHVHPLVAEQLTMVAAAALLTTFPNTTMTQGYEPGAGQVAPAVIRRATAYIEGHADEPLTITEIAAAAGVGPRALQYGFARHHQTTPMGYLRRVRLERAHRDLQAADPTTGDTVAAIAARWGFGHAGRFATTYRQVYGITPHDTLRS